MHAASDFSYRVNLRRPVEGFKASSQRVSWQAHVCLSRQNVSTRALVESREMGDVLVFST